MQGGAKQCVLILQSSYIHTSDVVDRIHTLHAINLHPRIPETRVLVPLDVHQYSLINSSKSMAPLWESCQISCPVREKEEGALFTRESLGSLCRDVLMSLQFKTPEYFYYWYMAM